MVKCGNCKQEGKTVEHVRYCYGFPAKSVAKSNNEDNNTDSLLRVPYDDQTLICNHCGWTEMKSRALSRAEIGFGCHNCGSPHEGIYLKKEQTGMEKFSTCGSCGRTVGVDGRCNCT